MMGMMGVFQWLRKDIIQRDRHRRTLPPKLNGLNNETYHSALHAFLERRKNPSDSGYILSPNSPDKARFDFFTKKNNENNTIKININNEESSNSISRLPNAHASEIFEIAWVAGTEDRYIDLIYAEWKNTKVCLRRQSHPDCKHAVKADLDVLGEIRHPNILLLMGTTHTDDHGIIAICEPINCTLFNYIHEQGERVAVQGIAKCARNLVAALNHAHMLGFIHSAISSHCVFLSSNGIVKLGGWELATDLNRPKGVRNYEERLRSEIFRWQAPELFIGQKPSINTDVYGITLLIWELSTMNIPWNGLNMAEVERQYVQWKQGVLIDRYNFPPLLNNLLEAGMQLDVSKRTLDMVKMSRCLQQLEMEYEDQEPMYIEQVMSNNDQLKSIFMFPINIPSSNKVPIVSNCHSNKTKKQYTKKLNSHVCSRKEKEEKKDKNQLPHINKLLFQMPGNRMKLVNEVFQNKNKENNNLINSDLESGKTEIQEIEKSESIRDDCNSKNTIIDLTNEHSDFNDSRLSIKKLKDTLASRRENFFYGDYSSLCDPTPIIDEQSKTSILSQVRSKDYEPHKPASHKTSLQPKQIISLSQVSTSTKTTQKKNLRSPYAYMPKPIKNAVIQPQVLNSDSQSFFETSLWQREKSICLSKMSHDNSQDSKFDSQYIVNHIQTQKSTPEVSDETFTVENTMFTNNSKNIQANFAQINDSSINITVSTIPRSKSLQVLNDTLERATELVKFNTPIISTSTDRSPYKSPQDVNETIDKSSVDKLVVDGTYEMNKEAGDEIKSINRSICSDIFSVELEYMKISNDRQKLTQAVTQHITRSELTHDISPMLRPMQTLKKFRCESIIKGLAEDNLSNIMTKEKEEKSVEPERIFVFNDQKEKKKGCFSCSRDLIRRRSLPVGLGQLRAGSYVSFEKMSNICDLSGTTVEDLYIDDEFDENSLAPNMILMNEDTVTDDENYFPDLLESQPKPLHS